MSFLIQPIKLSDNKLYCLNPATKQTEWVLSGDAVLLNDGVLLFETPALSPTPPISPTDSADSGSIHTGAVEFGVSCGVTSISFSVEYEQETKQDGYDTVKIFLNNALVVQWASTARRYGTLSSAYPSPAGAGTFIESDGYSRPYETVGTTDTFTLSVTPSPCGNVIRVEGTTGDTTANNNVYAHVQWTVS